MKSLVLLFSLMIPLTLSAAEVTNIIIRKHTVVRETRMLSLADVVESPLDAGVRERWSRIELAPGLKIGEKVEFSGESLTRVIRSELSDEVRGAVLNIPERVSIENVGSRPDRFVFENELRKKWEAACLCSIKFDELQIPQFDNWVESATWSIPSRAEAPRGTFTLPLQIRSGESAVETHWLKGRVSWWRKAPVARQALTLGQRLQEGDVEFVDREITFSSDGVPTPAETYGRVVKQGVAAGQVLFSSMLQREKAMRRGDVVKVSVGDESWEVSTSVVAEQDGELGDLIRVRNPRNQQILTATVVGRREVRVE